jgi:cell division protein FtsI (penicillin-binding protein 3)
MGFGHGISVTPIHFIQAFSAIVNGGILRKATLLKDNQNNYATRVFKKKTSLVMNKILYLTAAKGTARKANAIEYIVGGKTGTAEIITNGKYNKDLNRAVCAAAFPMHNPKYAIFVMLDEPKGNKINFGFTTGGMVAAPAMKQIIEKIAPILDVHPIDNKSTYIEKALYINDKPIMDRFAKK